MMTIKTMKLKEYTHICMQIINDYRAKSINLSLISDKRNYRTADDGAPRRGAYNFIHCC